MIPDAHIFTKLRESLPTDIAKIVAITGCKYMKTPTVVGFNLDKP
jgi:hypothetical protein